MRDEDQIGARRWLFECLEQRIRGGDVHPFRRDDDRDLRHMPMARELRPVDQRANVRDGDPQRRRGDVVVVELDGLDDAQIRMLARLHIAAACTHAARESIG